MNDPVAMSKALEIVVDTRNLPVLVHSNKGKHRVGVLVGIMRKMLQGWSLAAIFDEYTKFAKGKGDADIEVSGEIHAFLAVLQLLTFYFSLLSSLNLVLVWIPSMFHRGLQHEQTVVH